MGLNQPILADTSAWIEYLRDTGSIVCERVDDLLKSRGSLATTDVVIMELLSGAGNSDIKSEIWGLMNYCVMLGVRPLFDYEIAADLYVRCRKNGFTPSNTNDLLISSVAIGRKVPLLSQDDDFERIAFVSTLELAA